MRLTPMLLLVLALPGVATAGDPAPSPPATAAAPPAAAQAPAVETWTYEREGIRQALDVTELDADVRAAVHAQLRTDGWRRVAGPMALRQGLSEGLRKDLEALVRGGGRLPPGYVPRALAGEQPAAGEPVASSGELGPVVGRLLLAYFAAAGQPARRAALEQVLRPLAEALTAAPGEPSDAVLAPLRRAAGARAAAAGADPVQGEILRLLRPPPGAALPAQVGGATLRAARRAGEPQAWVACLPEVPCGCAARRAGLRPGDRLLAVDGAPVDPPALRRLAATFLRGGQRSLRLLRRDGSIATLDLDIELEVVGAETTR